MGNILWLLLAEILMIIYFFAVSFEETRKKRIFIYGVAFGISLLSFILTVVQLIVQTALK